ncbi:MAG: Mrp/NBP35 family ATP-binding protein [Thermoplasmata archaeon]|nr:Mrp/NBP35 family ATP-binding protein [Thermoplasmata archaeon]
MADQNETRKIIDDNLSTVSNIIAVMSGKGGVGKTSIAVNLAYALEAKGKSVGLLDADFTGPNVPKMLGIENETITADRNKIIPVKARNGISVISTAFLYSDRDLPVIWRGPIKMQVINQFLGEVEWGKLDYLIIDLPPGTGDESLSIAQQIPGANALIVTTPQDVALLDSRKSVTFAKQLNMNVLGIIENMSGMKCPHCGKNIDLFKNGGGENAAKELGVNFLGRLPLDPHMVLAGDSGNPLIENDDSEISSSFLEIVNEIEEILKNKGGN